MQAEIITIGDEILIVADNATVIQFIDALGKR